MLNSKRWSLIHWLILATLFKQIVFAAVIPLWHGPDEQAHFAQVQYIAEFGHPVPNDNKIKDLSQEIFISEQLLGIERDVFGKNKFTHHPDYRIDYTPTTIGKYEPLINHLPKDSRTSFVKFEATRYPPLFYYLSAVPYRLAYQSGLIDRVFVTRLLSVLMAVITVWLAYLIGRLLFSHNLDAVNLSLLVSFPPMVSFLFSSVTSDNLMNLLFTLFLYLCIKIIATRRLTLPLFIGFVLTIIAGLFTKPHFIIIFPILLVLPLFLFKHLLAYLKHRKLPFAIISCLLLVIILIRFLRPIQLILSGQGISFSEISACAFTCPVNNVTLREHFRWTLRHTIAEVIPWYWGVFNWLGVTLPRVVNRVVNRVMIVSATGFLIWVWKNRRIKIWKTPQLSFVFLQISAAAFFVILFLWDWLFVRSQGFSFGMQGRYYFPTLVSHMAFLLVGWTSLIPKSWWAKVFGLGMIALNFVGLHTLTSAYYETWPLSVFFNQVSQYKPVYFKFPYLLIWFTLYLVSLIIFLIKYLSYADNQRSRIQARR